MHRKVLTISGLPFGRGKSHLKAGRASGAWMGFFKVSSLKDSRAKGLGVKGSGFWVLGLGFQVWGLVE